MVAGKERERERGALSPDIPLFLLPIVSFD